MRVCLDISAALAGDSGIKFYVEELLGGLARVGREHEFLLYAAFWKSPERIESLRLPRGPNFRPAYKRLPQRLLLPAEEYLRLGLVERWLRGWGADLFHGLGNILPPLRRVGGVVTVHHVGGALDSTGPWSRFYFNRLAAASAKRADAVIAVSEFSRREAVAAYGITESRAFAVLEGGPAPAFSPAPEGAAAPPPRGIPKPFLLYLGGILERKNLLNLISALGLLRAAPAWRNLVLVLAGRRGEYYSVVRDFAASSGLAGAVLFPDGPAREEIVALYRHASVFVYPSLLEGFGFPALEAMACGTPVVASTSGAMPEVAGNAALLVDCRDPAALAGAVRSVLDSPRLAAKLRARGLSRVRQFSWERAAAETIAVYERVLAARRPAP